MNQWRHLYSVLWRWKITPAGTTVMSSGLFIDDVPFAEDESKGVHICQAERDKH